MGEQEEPKHGLGRAFLDYFSGPPKDGGKSSGSSKGSKSSKPLTPAQARRKKQEEERRLRRGARYTGRRSALYVFAGAFVVVALVAVIALGVGASKVSPDQVDALVDKRLEDGGRSFPEGESVMWAGQVLRVWGTWDENNAEARRVSLAPYLSSGMDEQAGWNAKGTQQIIYSSVNPQPEVLDANHALVSASYQTSDGNWSCVDIPVYGYKPKTFNTNGKWAFALGGNPTPTACSARTGAPNLSDDYFSKDKKMTENTDVSDSLKENFLPGFFSAYASSDADSLAQYAASGVEVVGLGGSMTSNPQPGIGNVRIWTPEAGPVDGKTYTAYVPVTWTLAGTNTEVTSVYLVPLVKNGDRWFVMGEPQAAGQSQDAQGGTAASIPTPDTDVTPEAYPSDSVVPTTEPEAVDPSDTDGGVE